MTQDSKVIVQSFGIGFTGLLTISFIVLKLTKVITWSWWWVLSPLWIPVALIFAFSIIVLIITVTLDWID